MNLKTFIYQNAKILQANSESALLDLQVLTAHVLGKNRSWVLAHLDEELTPEQLVSLKKEANRLCEGVPLPYILGEWEFFGHRFFVSPDVLIPRPETELMVEKGLEWITKNPEARVILDVGTGSGCIAISIALAFPNHRVIATDKSFLALKVAQKNISLYQLENRVLLIQADLLPRFHGKIDLVCANLPYIPQDELFSLQVAKQEPLMALDGGEDGLRVYRKLLAQLRGKLNCKALILCECAPSQIHLLDDFAKWIFPGNKSIIYPDLGGQERLFALEVIEQR